MQASSVLIKNLGLVEYQDAYIAMQSFTKERLPTTPDELWILQHPPIFTLGLAGNPANLHRPINHIPLLEVDRGGEITYHGPGQIIIYLLVDLKRKKLFVKELVRAIEQDINNYDYEQTMAEFDEDLTGISDETDNDELKGFLNNLGVDLPSGGNDEEDDDDSLFDELGLDRPTK